MAAGSSQHITASLVALLKPVARFALKRGLNFGVVSEALKRSFLLVAQEELKSQEVAANTSRLSVMTGLQRKDIKRISDPLREAGKQTNLLMRIVGQWQAHRDYTDTKGNPRALKVDGAESEFSDLVRSVSVDVSPYTVLFGLIQLGLAEKKAGKLHLKQVVYGASASVHEGLEMLSEDCNDLICAVEENLFQKPEIPNLHITTVYDNICVENLSSIRDWLLDQGSAFHEKVRTYLAKFDKDANPRLYKRSGGARVAVSAFSSVQVLRGDMSNET